ncbi:sodium:solute symporter [Gulosibacter macacae]
MVLDIVVIVLYILLMLGVGYWGYRRTKSHSDYLVAGRRLGTFMYASTLSALVLGGASLVGGIGLGYKWGISGAWLVTAIALGVLLLSALLAKRLTKLRIYTVSQMLDLRYGGRSAGFSGTVMFLYTFMLAVTSTLAYATVFHVLFGWETWVGILVGGVVVVLYSSLGGMWSITITDMAQFIVTTVGVFAVLLPMALINAGGYDAIVTRLGDSFASPFAIGGSTIVTYIVIYTLSLLIGQDIWQRVFTARTPAIAQRGGIGAGVYCLVFGIVGAIIGMAAHALLPDLEKPDQAFAAIVEATLPHGIRGLVLAAGLAAMMSTASGALIAASTVFTADLLPLMFRRFRGNAVDAAAGTSAEDAGHGDEFGLRGFRGSMMVIGAAVVVTAMSLDSVVGALTIAYNILVGGLLVPIIGGIVWKRATRIGAYAAIIAGAVAVIVGMLIWGDLANEPIYVGLGASAIAFVIASLVSKPTPEAVMTEWRQRLARGDHDDLSLDTATVAAGQFEHLATETVPKR